jgi:hypothetical protein
MGLKSGIVDPLRLLRSAKHWVLLVFFAAVVFYAGANFNARYYRKVTIGVSVRTSSIAESDGTATRQGGGLDRAIVVARHSEVRAKD